jgi:hypothetical protein
MGLNQAVMHQKTRKPYRKQSDPKPVSADDSFRMLPVGAMSITGWIMNQFITARTSLAVGSLMAHKRTITDENYIGTGWS